MADFHVEVQGFANGLTNSSAFQAAALALQFESDVGGTQGGKA